MWPVLQQKLARFEELESLLSDGAIASDPVKSGALVLFVFVGNIGAKPTTAFLINRFGFRHVLVAACIVLSASIGVAGFFTRDTSLAVIVIVSVISGAARSIGGTAYNTLAFCDIPEERMSHANSMAATATQLAAGLGVAVATVALRLGEPLGTLSAGHESLASTYAAGFVLMAVLPLVALAGILRMPSHAGNAARRLASHPTTPSAPEDDTPRVAAQP